MAPERGPSMAPDCVCACVQDDAYVVGGYGPFLINHLKASTAPGSPYGPPHGPPYPCVPNHAHSYHPLMRWHACLAFLYTLTMPIPPLHACLAFLYTCLAFLYTLPTCMPSLPLHSPCPPCPLPWA